MTLEKPLHFFSFYFFEGPLFCRYELCHPPNPLNQKVVFWHSGFGRTFSPIYVTAWLPVREDHVKPVWTGGGHIWRTPRHVALQRFAQQEARGRGGVRSFLPTACGPFRVHRGLEGFARNLTCSLRAKRQGTPEQLKNGEESGRER